MIALRDYQIGAVSALTSCRAGIIHSPAGSGKTIIAAEAIRRFVKSVYTLGRRPVRVAWIAYTIEQIGQAQAAIAQAEIPAGMIDIEYSCYAGMPDIRGTHLVLIDEAHHIGSPEFRRILDGFTGWRWGVTATPYRADEYKNDVFKLIGPIVHTVHREALVDAGQLATARVIIHQPNRQGEMDREVHDAAMPLYNERLARWPFMFRTKAQQDEQLARCIWQVAARVGIVDNAKRNARLIELCERHREDSHLLLVSSVEHGEWINAKAGGELVYSGIGKKKRTERIRAFADGTLKLMIATSLADEGLDVPRANVLTLASAGKSATKAEQRTGRVLRAFHDKTHGMINDFMDVQHFYTHNQSRKRISLYKSLGYEIRTEGR